MTARDSIAETVNNKEINTVPSLICDRVSF